MKAAPDIRRPEAVDAAWLTRALQAGGVDAVVESFTAKPVGTGQIGDSVRFALTYARGGETAPASVVGKFPSADPTSFATGVALGNYVRRGHVLPPPGRHRPASPDAHLVHGRGRGRHR